MIIQTKSCCKMKYFTYFNKQYIILVSFLGGEMIPVHVFARFTHNTLLKQEGGRKRLSLPSHCGLEGL